MQSSSNEYQINGGGEIRLPVSSSIAVDKSEYKLIGCLVRWYHITAFVIGQKFIYSDQNIIPVQGITEIRLIPAQHSQPVTPPVLLLKTGDHYDCSA